LPTGSLPGDVSLLASVLQGTNTLATQGSPPPLIPGRRYFLGVQNTRPTPATFGLEVEFNGGATSAITVLSNQVPVFVNIGGGGTQYYSFTVPPNAAMVTFQAMVNPGPADVDLYARAGLPVPGPLSFDYESANSTPGNQYIVISTNSAPVPLVTATTNSAQPLTPTTWYLTVSNATGVPITGYTMLATFMTNGPYVPGTPTMEIVPLTNGVPAFGIAAHGWPTNLLYSFAVPGNPAGVEFTVSNTTASGNVELLVSDGKFPMPEQSYSGSFNPGTAPQIVEFGTNSALPTLAGTTWYLAVPNTSIPGTPVNYSITATTITNGVVIIPAFIGASLSSPTNGFSLNWTAVAGQYYTIEVSTNLTSWVVATNIVAQSTTATYMDSVPADSQTSRFFRIVIP
jgi:hypothetical protein